MYLKRLDMYGFKSFMDKISVSFDYAITAIVGPNGSGKSNITDAIRWVLGEQSVKSLRGSRMEDVIFAGTAKHKPVSFAEVSLTLDNTSGLFSSPYTEITVTRRVYRSGESEYFINKTPCRLRDIHELFMDTGLGRDGYSVISQGQIDAVLSQKSEDRRQIFEEAAGISKYKYKKNEALRKLAATEENLVRVRDVADVLAARLAPLESQAKKARTYLDLYEKLKELEINLSLLDIEKLQEEKTRLLSLCGEMAEEVAAEEARLAQLQASEERLFGEMKNRDAEMENVRSLLHSTDLSVKGLEGDTALLQQRMETEKAEAERRKETILSLKAALAESEEAILAADSDIAACKAAMSLAETEVESGKARLTESAEAIRRQTAIVEELSTVSAQLLTQAEETEKYAESLLGEDLPCRMQTLLEEQASVTKSLQETEALLLTQNEEKKTLNTEIAKTAEAFRKKAAERPALQSRLAELKNTYNERMRQYNQKLSRKNTLADMEKAMEGYALGVRSVLSAQLSPGIHGVLSRLIHVDSAYITAIETALGSASQNIVVEREEDAKAAIAHLKHTRAGRATFLPLSAIRGRKLENLSKISTLPGFVGLGCDLVSCDAVYREILLHLLGTTVVMDTIENAIAAARKFSHSFKIVTLEGEVFMRGGSMSGGSRATHSHLLGRSEEIAALDKECKTLSTSMQKAEAEIDQLTDQIADSAKALDVLRQAHDEKKTACMQIDGQIRLFLARKEDAENRLARLAADIKSVQAQMENADLERRRLADAAQAFRQKHADSLLRADAARSLLRQYMEEQSERREALSDLQIVVHARERDVEVAQMKRDEKRLSAQKLQGDIDEQTRLQAAALQNIEALHLRYQNRLLDITEAKKRAEDFQNTLSQITAAKETADDQSVKMRADLQAQTEKLYALKNEQSRLETQQEKVQSDLDNTVTHLWDAYELTYSAAERYRKDIGSIGPARTEAASLRRSIRTLGSVNVDAISEYAEVSERHAFLSAQISDLDKAKAELETIVSDMTKVMTETFATRFAEIAAHFKDTFRVLFGGGTGCISLADPQHVLESGIDIDVQPPGKKLQSLSLLSGGEKALTAIAILFSVLRVRPAPFCILDEIESALDDHNIDRFAAYLRNYADTQFIIVTHRRGTMEAADVLYGVTMQEKGLSKLLTMQLSDIKKS